MSNGFQVTEASGIRERTGKLIATKMGNVMIKDFNIKYDMIQLQCFNNVEHYTRVTFFYCTVYILHTLMITQVQFPIHYGAVHFLLSVLHYSSFDT